MAASPAAADRAPTLRVAMVIQRFRPIFTGQGVQLELLCRRLAAAGTPTTIYTAAPPGVAPGVERLDGYRVRRLAVDLLPGRRLWMPIFGWQVFRALMREKPELVHVHGLGDGLYGGWLYAALRRRPLIFEMTLMGVDDPASARAAPGRPRWLRWAMFRRCDAYVAMSGAFRESFIAEGLSERRLVLIPQGVDTRRFRPLDGAERRRARRELELTGSAPTVVFVGSLVRRKGIDLLLRAWRTIRAAHPTARLFLVGRDEFPDDSEDAGFLERCIAELAPQDAASIHRVGLRDRVDRWLAVSDVFVLPTRSEGFGSAIIEAMAVGLPCVVTRLPGITDLIFEHAPARPTGASDGVVVEQEDTDRLARAVVTLLARPELRSAIGDAARLRSAAFDIGRVAEAYRELYAGLVTGGTT